VQAFNESYARLVYVRACGYDFTPASILGSHKSEIESKLVVGGRDVSGAFKPSAANHVHFTNLAKLPSQPWDR
jgi:hypothetical protein